MDVEILGGSLDPHYVDIPSLWDAPDTVARG